MVKYNSNDGVRQFKTIISLSIVIVLAVVALWIVTHTFKVVNVEGNEVLVLQDWKRGVLPETLGPGTKFLNGWTTQWYKYNIGTQKLTFDSKESNNSVEYDRIVVDCGENGGQKAYIAMSVNYRLGWTYDPSGSPVYNANSLIKLHNDGVGKTYEDVIVKRTVVDVINKIARPNQALDIYSGKGFVSFKEAVDKELKNHPVFKERGIYVENTIIYKVYLDAQYEQEIAQKVIAIQQTLKLKEQTKAKEEEAKMIFAQSQAKVEVMRQEAEAEKIKMITKAEAEKERQVLAAEGEKQKRLLEAEGERDANLAKAAGILAVGKAEAEVAVLKTNALYAGEGGERRTKVEIATAQAEKIKGLFDGVKIVPEKTILQFGESSGLVVNPEGKDK